MLIAKSATHPSDKNVHAHSKPGIGVVGFNTASIFLFDITINWNIKSTTIAKTPKYATLLINFGF